MTDVTLEYADPTSPHTLDAAWDVDAAAIADLHLADGCCPTVGASASYDPTTLRVSTAVTLTDDLCDCFTGLSVRFRVHGIPSGSWTVTDGALDAPLVVP